MTRKAVLHLKRADPTLAALIASVGPCRFAPDARGTHFEALARAVVFQQLSGKAATTIHTRFVALFPESRPAAPHLLDLPDEPLRAAGLSRQKIAYLRDLAHKAHAGEVPLERIESLGDDEIIAALAAVKGIGRWTAQMFLMFRLGRPDVLPEGDLGIQKAVQKAYRMRQAPTPKKLRALGERWAPYRTVASWYLWRSLDNGGGQLG